MTSDAELTGLNDDIADLISAHGLRMEDFIWQALLFYADQSCTFTPTGFALEISRSRWKSR